MTTPFLYELMAALTNQPKEEPMKINDLEQRQAWLAFASAALSGLGGNPKKKFDQVLDDAADLADEMLNEYMERFEPGYEPEPDEEEEEEEDEEGEDEEEEERPAKRRTAGNRR
jgi:hypothetical protein